MRTGWNEDIYLTLGQGAAPGDTEVTIRVFIKPMILWLWIGGGVMALGTVLASRVFELSIGFDPWLWVIGMTAGVAIVGSTGVLATRRVVNHPPVEALRTF